MGFAGAILVFNYDISVGAILIFNDDKSYSWKSAAASPFPPPSRRSVSIFEPDNLFPARQSYMIAVLQRAWGLCTFRHADYPLFLVSHRSLLLLTLHGRRPDL